VRLPSLPAVARRYCERFPRRAAAPTPISTTGVRPCRAPLPLLGVALAASLRFFILCSPSSSPAFLIRALFHSHLTHVQRRSQAADFHCSPLCTRAGFANSPRSTSPRRRHAAAWAARSRLPCALCATPHTSRLPRKSPPLPSFLDFRVGNVRPQAASLALGGLLAYAGVSRAVIPAHTSPDASPRFAPRLAPRDPHGRAGPLT